MLIFSNSTALYNVTRFPSFVDSTTANHLNFKKYKKQKNQHPQSLRFAKQSIKSAVVLVSTADPKPATEPESRAILSRLLQHTVSAFNCS